MGSLLSKLVVFYDSGCDVMQDNVLPPGTGFRVRLAYNHHPQVREIKEI